METMRLNSLLAYIEAIFVTFLWSSSFILVKFGLLEVPPLLLAALRYGIAFTILGVISLMLGETKRIDRKNVTKVNGKAALIIAGICGYTIAQGFQVVGLFYLPAVTTSFLLNFTPIFVLLLGISFLGEKGSKIQMVGLAVAIAGGSVFFSEKLSGASQLFGITIVVISGVAWAVYMVVIRRIQRVGTFGSLKLTTATMGIGTLGLVILAVLIGGLRSVSLNAMMIILWLSLGNTTLAFLLWNHALRSIHAYELSVIQNTMLIQIAILAWIFLGELLTYFMIIGVILVILGVVLVQIPAINRAKHYRHRVAVRNHVFGRATPSRPRASVR
jgi:drug/metabolite transporter (DMT)-like permease